jgi:hypothetical protein
MPAPSVVIEELVGATNGRQRKKITLRGRSLPFQNVKWGHKTRTKTTWYPGNPVATIQVLGPELPATTMEGMWKARFLPGQAELEGFGNIGGFGGDVLTPEILIAAMREIVRSGNDLRVQWGFETRFGVLSSFEADWVRPEDVRWTAEFTWSGEQEEAPRAGAAPLQQGTLRRASTALDDDFGLDPPPVLPDFRAAALERINALRERVGDVFDQVREVQGIAELPISAVQGALSAIESVRSETEELVGSFTDTPYTVATTSDRVVDVLSTEYWRGTSAYRANRQRAAAQRQGLELAKMAVPDAIQVIVVPGEATLRSLALTYYGSSDDWQLIADVNGLVDSLVPAGTVLVITPRPASRVIA